MTEKMEATFTTTDFEQSFRDYPKEITAEDTIETLISKLEQVEDAREIGIARKTLDKIREILDKPDTWNGFKPEEEYCRTLLAVHKMLRANPIRLRYQSMDISGYFKLLDNVKMKLFNKNSGVNIERQVVAEEMSKLGLYPQVLTEKWEVRECRPPNRAFMDILHKVNPNLACEDLKRREYSKLDNTNDKRSKEEIEKKLDELEGK